MVISHPAHICAGKPNKSSHDTMITNVAHDRGIRSQQRREEEVCAARGEGWLRSLIKLSYRL
jgi:hypothetical protein